MEERADERQLLLHTAGEGRGEKGGKLVQLRNRQEFLGPLEKDRAW